MFCVNVLNNYNRPNIPINFKPCSTFVNWKTKMKTDTNSLAIISCIDCVSCLVLQGDESNKTIFRDQLVHYPQANSIKTSTWRTIESPEHGVELIFDVITSLVSIEYGVYGCES
jgi:hypothetical protein